MSESTRAAVAMAEAVTQTLAEMTQHMQAQAAAMEQITALAGAPKRIVRDPVSGKALGVEVAQ